MVAQLPHIASPSFVIPHGTSLLPSSTHNEWPLARTLHVAKGTLKVHKFWLAMCATIAILAQHNWNIIT